MNPQGGADLPKNAQVRKADTALSTPILAQVSVQQ